MTMHSQSGRLPAGNKPDGYPLPWSDHFGMPWWAVNLIAIGQLPAWSVWQASRAMSDIIPVLRWLSGLSAERGS
jgi:hypothetical protein